MSQASPSSSSSSAAPGTPAQPAPGPSRKKLKFSSKEVLDLCWSRRDITRFPDLLARQNAKLEAEGVPLSAHSLRWAAVNFRTYVLEHENSQAEFRLKNDVDREPHPPLDFCWTNEYVLGSASISHGAYKPHGCDCDEDECEPDTCSCLTKMKDLDPQTWKDATDFAYDADGNLHSSVADQSVIWECNDLCGCAETCRNRNVQHGRRHGIELFKTDNGRGWGLRAIDDIPARSFVLCYTGELIDGDIIDKRGALYNKVGMSYMLHIDAWHVKLETLYKPYNAERIRQNQKPLDINSAEIHKKAVKWRGPRRDPMLTVDAAFWANISRYINHSCEPNLSLFPVYFGPHAGYVIRPYLVFFSKRKISAGEELTFSYSGQDGDEDESQQTEDDDEDDDDDGQTEPSSSQFPRSLSTKGHKGKLQRKIFETTEDEDELQRVGAQKCLCGMPKCRGKFWR